MDQQTQVYLAERLLALRELGSYRGTHSDMSVRMTLASVGGAVEALHAVGALTDEEHRDWRDRALEAAGIPPEQRMEAQAMALLGSQRVGRTATMQAASRASMQVSARPGPWIVPPPPSPPPLPRFIRLIPAPNEEREFFGGRLRLPAVEIWDTEVAVQWLMSPLPDIALAMPEETSAFERDIAGLPEDEARRLRHRRPHAFHLAQRFTVGDDLGTAYPRTGGGSHGSATMAMGRIVARPAPPPEAGELRIDALGEVFTIPLPEA